MQELSSAERAAVQTAVSLGLINRMNVQPGSPLASWRYASVGELLADQGRFFTSGPIVEDRGAQHQCYRNAAARADASAEVYVEGLASISSLPIHPLEHAWCADGTVAIDPTWTNGGTYYGIPFTDHFRQQRRQETGHVQLLWTPSVMDLLPEGLPDDAVADVGRPVPPDVLAQLHAELAELVNVAR